MKVILKAAGPVATPAVMKLIATVHSCASFFIRCFRDDDASRMCVSVLKLLHSQERSGLLLKDHAERLDWAETFMSVCVDKVFQEMQNYSFYEAAVPMLLMCKQMMEESDGLDSAIVAVICNNLALLYQVLTLTLCTLCSPPPLTSISAFSEARQARPSARAVQPILGGALKALWTRLLARGR